MTIFVDGIAISNRFKKATIPELAGIRRIAFRQSGDLDLKGKTVIEDEIIGETLQSAWIQGSHDSRLQMKSDGELLQLMGNPGRFGRPENLFNLDLDATVAAANRIAAGQGFPSPAFEAGELDTTLSFTANSAGKLRGRIFTGARIWSIHLTQNYVTGSARNARSVMQWLNTQSVSRVKKKRHGSSTITWGSLKYCQTEVYDKAPEMLVHCKSQAQRKLMKKSEAYKYAEENGIIRLEIKCAKDFLRERNLTYLGSWDMGTVHKIFAEKAEVLERCSAQVEESVQHMPQKLKLHYAAWLSGVDLAEVLPRSTFFRVAKNLREYKVDIAEARDVAAVRPILEAVYVTPAAIPDWYRLNVA
jgi:hypothetical protein